MTTTKDAMMREETAMLEAFDRLNKFIKLNEPINAADKFVLTGEILLKLKADLSDVDRLYISMQKLANTLAARFPHIVKGE